MYEQTSMIAPPQAEAKPAARYYEINEDTARNAHYCVHMSDYQPGSATNGYRAAMTRPPRWWRRVNPRSAPTTTTSSTRCLTATPAA